MRPMKVSIFGIFASFFSGKNILDAAANALESNPFGAFRWAVYILGSGFLLSKILPYLSAWAPDGATQWLVLTLTLLIILFSGNKAEDLLCGSRNSNQAEAIKRSAVPELDETIRYTYQIRSTNGQWVDYETVNYNPMKGNPQIHSQRMQQLLKQSQDTNRNRLEIHGADGARLTDVNGNILDMVM